MSQYKAVLVQMDEADWEVFREIYLSGKRSAKIRELIRREIEAFTREEVQAQSLAGLTEA